MLTNSSLSAPATRRASAFAGYKPLIWMSFIALALRVCYMATQTPVMSLDGSEYVRMAENLAAGKGLIGNFEGPETMYAPLFSVLTTGVCIVIKNAELAAHLVTLVFGTALIIPVFFIALRMYGSRIAYLSAALVAFNPLFIALSASVYNENVYLTLLLAAVYFGMRCLESHGSKDYMLLGVCLALGYMSRPEAFAYPAVFTVLVWGGVIFGRISTRQAMLATGLLVGTFLLVASPYISFLYAHTGQMRLEGKWNINYTIANRIRSGMGYDEAASGLGPGSGVAGPLLDPFRFASYTPYSHSLADKLQTLWAMAKRNRKEVSAELLSPTAGAPLVLALALLGLFRKTWTLRRLVQELVVIGDVSSVLLFAVTASIIDFRYILPAVAPGLLWVAKGTDEACQWVRSLVSTLNWRYLPNAHRTGAVVRVSLVLMVFGAVLYGVQTSGMFVTEREGFADLKQAGLWLRDLSPGPKKIACMGTVPTYYAKGTIIGLPYAESVQALRYVDSQNVDFIFLDYHYTGNHPEAVDWIKHGIPDRRAHLIFSAGAPASRIAIYRWVSDAPSSPRPSATKNST